MPALSKLPENIYRLKFPFSPNTGIKVYWLSSFDAG
jgi:hypothetical protein